MKSEKMYDGITNIDDELIISAGEYRNKKKKRPKVSLIASIAASAIIIVALGFFMKNSDFDIFTGQNESISEETTDNESNNFVKNENDVPPANASQMLLSSANYPAMAKYPVYGNEIKYDEEFDAAYKAWSEDVRNLRKINFESENIDSFSVSVMNELLTGAKGENKAVSPINIYMALCVLAETCGGESREQILSLMGVSSVEELREQANKVWRKNYRDDGVMKSILANSIWLNDTMEYNKKTLDIIADKYFASSYSGTMGSESYNEMLNFWIREQTGGLLSPDIKMTPQTVLAIASTILFNSKWNDEFSPEKTEKGIFKASSGDKEVEYMKATRLMQYCWGDSFSAIALNLDIGGKMWFILPDEGVDADAIFSDSEVQKLVFLSEMDLLNNEKSKFLRVNITLPKFDIECKSDIVEALKNLGITDIMSAETADFSPLCDETIWLDKAEHGVRVKTDEEGVSAAAYTVLMEAGSAMPPDEIVDFTVDRPFAFAVTFDGDTILFAGVVNNP